MRANVKRKNIERVCKRQIKMAGNIVGAKEQTRFRTRCFAESAKGVETVERDNVSRDSSADDGFREEVSARVGQSRRFERIAEVRGGTIARGFGENSKRKIS